MKYLLLITFLGLAACGKDTKTLACEAPEVNQWVQFPDWSGRNTTAVKCEDGCTTFTDANGEAINSCRTEAVFYLNASPQMVYFPSVARTLKANQFRSETGCYRSVAVSDLSIRREDCY